MTYRSIINLLRSGNFTIVYWDSGDASLYKGKWNYNKECERDEYETMNKSLVAEYSREFGYCPEIVDLLCAALKGKADSI